MKFLPATKSNRWFLWMAFYGVFLWLLFILQRFILLDHEVNGMFLFRLALVSVLISIIINGLGWVGARLVWVITTVGIIIGMGLMFGYTYRDMSGWEDLAGFLTFSLFSMIGFVVGLLAEGIHLLIKGWPKT